MKSVDAVTAAIKPFRDNYVVHRAVKNPLASRGVILDSLEPTVRISISQVKRDGTPLGFQTADCGEVYTLILIYTDQVLDLIESPRRS
jgi:hypothetical protein